MHDSVRDFFARMKMERPSVFAAVKVAEFGSYDINGNPRHYFPRAVPPAGEYVGIDWRTGPKVDEVSLAHEYKGREDGYFQTIVTSSMLEHDPYWIESLNRMCALLAIGGSILITTTAPGFHVHEVETAPEGPASAQGTYFSNLRMKDVLSVLSASAQFFEIRAENDTDNHDIRIMAFSKQPWSLEVK